LHIKPRHCPLFVFCISLSKSTIQDVLSNKGFSLILVLRLAIVFFSLHWFQQG
jgi:hypothetical protein